MIELHSKRQHLQFPNYVERIFATHGKPTIIESDNGPLYTSQEFQLYMTEIGVKHQKITLHWPQTIQKLNFHEAPYKSCACSTYREEELEERIMRFC